MELNKLNLSSLFGDKMNQIDYITGLVTDDDSKMIPSSKSSTLQTETLNLSNEIENVKTPTSPENIDNTNSITGSNIGTTYNQTNNYTPSYEQQQTGNIGNDQQISREVTINETTDSNNSPQISTIKADDVNTLDRKTQNTSQVIKITEEGNSDSSTSFSGNAVSNQNSKSSTTTEKELTTDKITSIKNMTTSKEDESGEQNKEITKMNTNTSGKKIKEDLSKRTQYEYDVEENTRKDEVDSSMQNMGIQDGEYDKYIKVLEKTIKSEEQHIQFTKDNDKRLAKLYGQKDSKTGEYTNAKELLDIINSDDPKKKIRYLPLTGKDGEKVTLEIWEEKYEEAKKKYKNNTIFQQKSYKSLTEEEKIKFVKELTKEEIKEAYKKEREQVYENNQEIDIEGNVGGLGLYLKENFEDLSEKDKIEFIGRYNNKKYAQLTFSVDDVKGWNEEIDEKSLEGMSNSIVDRETSVKQLKYLKKEAEMQKEIYQYEKVVYTEDYKNYTEKGTKGYEDKKKYLNSEQNKILDYIYNKQGEEKADEYIEALRGQIAKGQGIEEANEFLSELESDPEKMNKFVETMKDADKFNKCLKEGVIDGVGTFGEGVKNFFVEDYELSALEWKEQAILEVLSNNTEYSKGWCDKAYQYGNVVGNLAPSMLTTAAVTAATGGAAAPEALSFAFQTTGELAGSLAMTISAAGNSKHQALINGAGTTEAWAYGICSGLSEATMERFLGSVPGLSKLEGGYFKKMISEGIEEGSQEFVSAVLNSVILGEDINIDDVISQAKESFTMGASVSALLNIGSLKKTNIKLKYKGETVKISEKARNKIQEEISKVNEGTIDAETGNKKALEILEKELNKKGNLKETINPEEIENIEIKGRKEKTDTDNKKEKISIESEKEKSSKELSSIEEKIRIASEDIKIINKQEKQEKKESKELESKIKLDKTKARISDISNISSIEQINSQQNTIGQYQSYTEISNLFNFGYQKDYKNVKLVAKDKTNLAKLNAIYRKNLKKIYTDSSNLQIILTDTNIIPNLNKGVDYSNVSQHGSLVVMSLSGQGINSEITINHEIQHLYGKVLKRINIKNLAVNITKYGLDKFLNQAHLSGLSEDLMINWINQRKNSVENIVRNQFLYNTKLENLTSKEILQLESLINTKVSKILKNEGVLSFADMWDAITGGKVYENTGIGHGKVYYEKGTVVIADELLAQYATLKKHKLLENFKSALPSDLLKMLDVAYNDTNTQLEIEKLIERGDKKSLSKATNIANSFESKELKNNFINYIEGIAKEKGYIKGKEINIKSPQGNNNIKSIQNIIDTNIKNGNFTEIANLLNQIKDNSEYNKVESYVKNYLVNLENYGALANIYKVLGDYTQAYRFEKLRELDNFIKNVNNISGSKYSAYVTDGVRADLKTTVWNQLINYYKGKEGITIKPWPNGAFLNFNIGTNIDTKTEPLSNSYKIYLALDKSTAYTSVTQIMDYLVKNNIKSNNKISKVTRADALVLRIDNQNDAIKVINFINNNALIPLRENTGISAAFKFNKVQLAMDGRTSYNSIATELISDYAKKNPGGSINGFRKYVNNLINEIKLGNLDNLKQTLGDSIMNIRADDYNAKVVNVIQIIQMLQLSLNPNSDISDYLNLGKKFQSKDVFNNMYAGVEQALGNYAAFAENSNFDVTNHIKNGNIYNKNIKTADVLSQYIKEENNKVNIPLYAESILYNYIIGINSSNQIASPYRKVISQMDIREIAQCLSLDADKVVSDKKSYSSALSRIEQGRNLMQVDRNMGLSYYKQAMNTANKTKNNLIIREIKTRINNQAIKYFQFNKFDDAYELFKLTKNEQELLSIGKSFVDSMLQFGKLNEAKQFSLKSSSVNLEEYTTSKLSNKIYESINKGNINKTIEVLKINYGCKSITDLLNAEYDIVKRLVEKYANYFKPTDNILNLKINNKIPEGARAMMIKYAFDYNNYFYPSVINTMNVVNDLESAIILSLLNQNIDITSNNIQKILNELNNNNTKSITKKLGALKYIESYLNKNSKAKKYIDLKTIQDIQSNYGVIPSKTYNKIEKFFKKCINKKITVNQNENFVTAFANIYGSKDILDPLLKYANNEVGQSFLSRLTVGEAIAVYNYTVGSGVFQRFVGTGQYDKYNMNSNINSYYDAKMNVDYLDSALEKGKGLTKNQIFYRGDNFDTILKFCGFKNYESLKNSIGKKFVCKSYLSTGVTKDGAFGGKIEWKIKCDAGKKYGAYINEISHYSKKDCEYEFLFRRNSKIRIDDVKKANDVIYLDVTILGIEGY